eukprot:3668594-Rhodomonas_salina.2
MFLFPPFAPFRSIPSPLLPSSSPCPHLLARPLAPLQIFEGDMHDPSLRADSPVLSALFSSDALPLAISSCMPELRLALGTSARTVKVQVPLTPCCSPCPFGGK